MNAGTQEISIGVMPSYRTPLVAEPDYVAELARIVEDAGCESIWAIEHVVVPADYTSAYPYAPDGRMGLTGDDPIPDPLDWLAFVAGCTSRLRLSTAIIILPEHNPVGLAKRLATIDRLSGGRLMIGVGVGWLREEAEALGTRFETRGARTDEYIDAMRALWSQPVASFRGPTVAFDRVKSEPKPVNGAIPIHIGGHSHAAARRAGRRGDGFYPLGVGPDELPPLLELMRAAATDAGRDPDGIEVSVPATRDLATAQRLVDLGARRFILSARGEGDLEALRRLIGHFRDEVVSKLT